jgi:hypothetical protein
MSNLKDYMPFCSLVCLEIGALDSTCATMLVAMLIIKAYSVCKFHLHGFGLAWRPTLIGCTFSFGFFQNFDSFQH